MQCYDIRLYKKCQLSVKIREKRPIEDIDAAKCAIDYSPSNKSGNITLDYVPTNDQPADVLTKGLAWEKHKKFLREIGLCCAD